MLDQAIRDFSKQFEYEPVVVNAQKLKKLKKFVVCAMGGSNHATDVLKARYPHLPIIVHRDYGLPDVDNIRDYLIVACSYSGNTEEPIDAFKVAVKKGLNVVIISKGGELIDLARASGAPYIQIPDTGIQPRSATGFMFMALLKLMANSKDLSEARGLSKIKTTKQEQEGKKIAQKLKGGVPVIYASTRNYAVANNWKIKFNENIKIPAFINVVPELNHNEMNGFDTAKGTKKLMQGFKFVFIKDSEDDPRVIKRMVVLEKLYKARGFQVENVILKGKNRLEKIFSSLILADWVSLYLANAYNVDPEPVPMVEEFKKLIA